MITDSDTQCTVSESEFLNEFFVGAPARFLPSDGSCVCVLLIFQCLHGAVVEFWRHNHRASTCTARRDDDGRALCGGDVVTLAATELHAASSESSPPS